MKINISSDEIALVKAANPLNEYLARRGVELQGTGNRLVGLCPFHDEKTPSYTVYLDGQDHHAHCFACSFHGDVIEHEQKFNGGSFLDAFRALGGAEDLTLSSIHGIRASISKNSLECSRQRPKQGQLSTRADDTRPTLPSDTHEGSPDELRELSLLRCLSVTSLSLASSTGVLKFATVCGFPSWLITDTSGKAIEARRLDGKEYPAVGKLRSRKGHALKGSRKNWPVGIQPHNLDISKFDTVVVVEGQPDLLAAYHFIAAAMVSDPHPGRAYKILPVAILGRSNTTLHPTALAQFRAKRVRVYPHADEDGKGREAGERWMKQIHAAGAAQIDSFDFEGLIRSDGRPVNDLNDCVVVSEADKPELKELLP